MLGEPDRVIAGAVHDLDPFQCPGVDRRQIDPPLGPAEELENPELHFSSASTVRQKSRAARAQRSGWSKLTPWPYPANSSSRPRGKVSARIFCCSEAMRLLSPLSSSTGALIPARTGRSEEHTSELQSLRHLVCRLLLEKKNNKEGRASTIKKKKKKKKRQK